jgi:ribose transport system substrate-binding protein
MNRVITLVSALALGVASLAMTAQAADKTFALVPKNMNNPFFDQARDGCQKAAAEIGGIECYYIGPGEHGGGDEQFQMVQDLIAKGVDGIAVSVSNAPAIARAAAAAKQAGIPFITWDSDLLDKDKALRATYIGTVNTEIGKELAKRLMELKPDGGTYCIQSGGPAAVNMNERMKGMLDTLPADKWTQVAGCPLYNNDDFPLSIVQMTDILAKYPDLDAMLNAGGAPQMLPEAYRKLTDRYADRIKSGDLVLLFVETMDVQMEFLKAGLSQGQVGQRPYEMGYRAIYVLNDLVNGKAPEDPITIGLDVCTPENIDSCKTK